MPFQKGKSGNPGGRSNEKAFANAIRAAVNATDEASGRRKLLIIAERVAEMAMLGEPWAVAQIADRLDGKPAQESTVNINRMRADEVSDNELADIATGSGEGTIETPLDPALLN